MPFWIGIDPGQSGGIAAVGTGIPLPMKMPETEKDICEAIKMLSEAEFAIIEKVHTMPDQGIHSAGVFMQSYGFLRGILTALEIPFTQVDPRTWQKALDIPPRRKKPNEETKTEFKNRLKAKAQQLFPSVKITLATSDALLIAEYCRLTHPIEQRPDPWDDL